jgi:hypothetical protein
MTLEANTTSIWTTSPCSKKFVDLIILDVDAFESYNILKAKKEGKLQLNNNDGNVNSTLLLNLAL